MAALVHGFDAAPVAIGALLGRDLGAFRYKQPTRRAGRAVCNKAGFYVIRFSTGSRCPGVLKIGRAIHGGGLLARLRDYRNKFGDHAQLLFATTFARRCDRANREQPVCAFEREVKRALRARRVPVLRGAEYFSARSLPRMRRVIEQVAAGGGDS